ncbi:hypothetical protein VB636_04240, partial [Paracoccus sp. APAP_BH8]
MPLLRVLFEPVNLADAHDRLVEVVHRHGDAGAGGLIDLVLEGLAILVELGHAGLAGGDHADDPARGVAHDRARREAGARALAEVFGRNVKLFS